MFRATMCPSSGADACVVLSPRVGMCCNNEWCYSDMSICEWAVCVVMWGVVGGGHIDVWRCSSVCKQINVHTEPQLHTTMRQLLTTPHITTHTAHSQRDISE
jgi:hypothetical protein